MTEWLSTARRVVVKVGSSTLVDDATGALRAAWFEAFVADLARLQKRGQEVLLVSSGAIALGRRKLGLELGTLRLEEAQAAAAIGQIALARAWSEGLAKHDIAAAQVLLTLADTEVRRRYLNGRATINALLSRKAIPVINENDTVATSEIRFGDNDRLAARVASMCDADCLVLLSDVDGLYTANPRTHADAAFVPEVHAITAELEAAAGGVGTAAGTGGMKSKLAAARIAMEAGVHMAITDGGREAPLQQVENGARATWFMPHATPSAVRKKWIAGALRPVGALRVDDGAAAALKAGKSLLPAGVTDVEGAFERGDCVRILDAAGTELGRGLIAYDAEKAIQIAGRRSSEIEAILGYRGRDEMIHRDDMVLRP